jgi:hypothetical protein
MAKALGTKKRKLSLPPRPVKRRDVNKFTDLYRIAGMLVILSDVI